MDSCGCIRLTRRRAEDNELCAACRLIHAMAEARMKRLSKSIEEIRTEARTLQGSVLTAPYFPHEILITRRSIKEWFNQPFRYYEEKNLMLLDIVSVMSEAKYLGTSDNHKGIARVVQSHIFETKVCGDTALIIVREYDWGDYVLHSISDSAELYKHIKGV